MRTQQKHVKLTCRVTIPHHLTSLVLSKTTKSPVGGSPVPDRPGVGLYQHRKCANGGVLYSHLLSHPSLSFSQAVQRIKKKLVGWKGPSSTRPDITPAPLSLSLSSGHTRLYAHSFDSHAYPTNNSDAEILLISTD